MKKERPVGRKIQNFFEWIDSMYMAWNACTKTSGWENGLKYDLCAPGMYCLDRQWCQRSDI